MLVYSGIMFLAAALFLALGVAVYRGRTDLLHAYHQTKVTDKAAYGRAFGKALFVFAVAASLSGAAGSLAASHSAGMLAVAVLIAGVCIGTGCIVFVQRKYNRGIF